MPNAKQAANMPQAVHVVTALNPAIIALDPSDSVIIAGNANPLAMTITVRDLDPATITAHVLDDQGVPDPAVPVTPSGHSLNELHVTIVALPAAKSGERDIGVTYGGPKPISKRGITIV